MIYYRKILTVLLGWSLFFVLLVDGVLLWHTLSRGRQRFEQELDEKMNRIAEFTDSRLVTNQLRTAIISSSDALYRYISAEQPQEYHLLVFSNYIKSLYTVTPTQQSLFAVSYLSNDYAVTTDYNTDIATMLRLFYMTPEQLEAVTRYFDEQFNAVCTVVPTRHEETNYIVFIRCAKNWHAQPVYFFSLYTEDQFFDTAAIGAGSLRLYQGETLVYTAEPRGSGRHLRRTASRIKVSETALFRYELTYPYQTPFTASAAAIVLTGIAAAAGMAALMYGFTRKLYKPIENILRLTDMPDSPVRAEDEFACISNTIQTLNQEVDTMSDSLRHYDQLLERTFLRELLCNYMPLEQAESRAARLRLTDIPAPLETAVIRYGSADESNSAGNEMPYNACFVLKQKLEQVFIAESKRFAFFRIIDVSFDTQALIVSAVGDNGRAVNTLKTLLSEVLAQQELTEQFGVCAAIGYEVSELWNIGASYRNALWLLEVRSYTASGAPVLTNADISQAVIKTAAYYPLSAEQALINAVIHKKIELWQSVLADVFLENRKREGQNTAQLALLLTATVQRILDGVQKTPEQIFGADTAVLLTMSSCKKLEELYAAVKSVLIRITEHLRAAPKTANPILIAQMEHFIKKNYTRNISLDDLAEAVNLSPNYVSTTFKNNFGRNFKDYLNYYRYEAACALIRAEPLKKVKEVAAACGCSTDILTRLFLKYGNMLPTDFQKQVHTL